MEHHSFRICKARWAFDAFSGDGARLAGGRWNSVGTPVVYTASSRALAALEMLVHLPIASLHMPYMVIGLSFSSQLVVEFPASRLPPNWRENPPPIATQRIGDEWARQAGSAVLSLPSAVVPGEHVFLMNPRHRDFAKISIGSPEEFLFDPRLAAVE